MLTEPPPAGPEPLDLLVVGGLTIDRFAGAAIAAGGSVLHATRAMHLDGRRTLVVTLSGPEEAARTGLDDLRTMAEVRAQRTERTIGFEHVEGPLGRELTFITSAGSLRLPSLTVRPRAVLYAPVADELAADLGGQRYPDAVTGAILQGWLRDLHPGERVVPRPLAELDPVLVDALSACDLLVASVDDLAAEAVGPEAQLRAMRRTFGPGPTLVVTAGLEGAWLAAPGSTVRQVPVPRRVDGVPTVGAGDALAAALLAGLSRGVAAATALADATVLVGELLAERTDRRVMVIGDIHGMLGSLRDALTAAGLVDGGHAWAGGRDELWFAGDLVDRGPDGIGVVELVMRLQQEAAAAGGRVGSVIGNHEIQLLAARAFPDLTLPDGIRTFYADWLANGGHPAELAKLGERHVGWLRELPVAARIGPALLVHSDAPLHRALGPSPGAANAYARTTLAERDERDWDLLLAAFSGRRAFLDPAGARELLAAWGGREVVHGHTTLPRLFGDALGDPGSPVRYADGRAVAVDGGAYGGGSIVIHRLAWP